MWVALPPLEPVDVCHQRIVIVGAGQAGARCAEILRAGGHDGPVDLVGDEAMLPYERPPLSKSLLAGANTLEQALVLAPDWYDRHAVRLHLGRHAVYVDRSRTELVLDDGRSLHYDTLVLATGAKARRLRVPGADLSGVHYLRTATQSLELRQRLRPGKRLVVIGGGFIGLEVAATASTMGVQVCVVEAAAAPMARVVPPEVGRLFAELHRRHGVAVHTHAQVDAIRCEGTHLAVRLQDGRGLDADSVVVGIGVVANDALAVASGLPVDDGILADASGRTEDPRIYAIGDCARFLHPLLGRAVRLEAWQHANQHAEAAACSILGADEAGAHVPWAWSDQYDANLQVTGAPDQWDALVWRGVPSAMAATLFQWFEGHVVGAVSINRAKDARLAARLIARRTSVTPEQLADPAFYPC